MEEKNTKNKYITPAIIISEVDTNTLLAGSVENGTQVVNWQAESDISNPSSSTANQFSKKNYNVWDDGEE